MSISVLVSLLFLLWVIVIAMGIAIVALARQVGVLHERLAPVGALAIGSDLEVGDPAPRISESNLLGEPVEVGAPLKVGEAQLLLFVAPTCPICKKLIPVAQRFASSERLKVLYVGDGDPDEQRQMAEKFSINPRAFVNSRRIGMSFRVSKLPYAVLIDHEGIVSAKGLVNSREHLESLVVARETGFASIQAYLTVNKITTLGD